MSNRDFRKEKQLNPAEKILESYAKKDTFEKKKLELNQDEVDINGKVFIIKKWKHMETLSRVPQFMNMWFAHLGITQWDQAYKDEIQDYTPLDSGTYIAMFIARFQDIEFCEYIEDFLSNVYLKGKDTPINIDDDLASPVDIFKLFTEVASANFMMQLCQTIFNLPSVMLVNENESLNHQTD